MILKFDEHQINEKNVGKSVWQLNAGDVIEVQTRWGRTKMLLLDKPSPARTLSKVDVVPFGVKDKYKVNKDEKLQLLTLSLRNGRDYIVVDTVSAKELNAIKAGYDKRVKPIEDLRRKREDTVMNALGYNSDNRRYELTLLNGDVVAAGDVVRVRFSNGTFPMVVGNSAGMIGNFAGGNRTGMVYVKNERKSKSRSVPYDRVLSKAIIQK